MVSTTHMCSLPLLKVGRGAVNQPAANCCMVDRASVVGDSFRTFRHLDSENLRDSLESLGLSIKQNVRVQRFVNILQIVMENSYVSFLLCHADMLQTTLPVRRMGESAGAGRVTTCHALKAGSATPCAHLTCNKVQSL